MPDRRLEEALRHLDPPPGTKLWHGGETEKEEANSERIPPSMDSAMGVIDRMNEVHFEQPIVTPIAESMLGGILSELASSFSVSPLEHRYSIDSEDESIISTVVRDHGSNVVTRRVTRRMSGRESRGEPSPPQTLKVILEETN